MGYEKPPASSCLWSGSARVLCLKPTDCVTRKLIASDFGPYLIGDLEHELCFSILSIMTPTDKIIFQRGRLNHQQVLIRFLLDHKSKMAPSPPLHLASPRFGERFDGFDLGDLQHQ